jgi:hypothetical protein
MRGYPILSDDLPSRLAELERRIARLEQPHKINYAQRFGWIYRSTFTSKPQVGTTYTETDSWLGIIGGPSALFVVEADSNLNYEVRYEQRNPTPATTVSVIASGTIVGGTGPFSIVIDTEAEQISGTFGRLALFLQSAGTFTAYTIYDSGFITADYEAVTS